MDCEREKMDTNNNNLDLEEEEGGPEFTEDDFSRFIPTPMPSLDATDLAIARALEREGRQSVQELSRQLGFSRATVSERLTRLIDQGVIKGFHARLDYRRMGYPLTAFVGLESVQGFNAVEVITSLKAISEVEEVHTVTGRIDMLVKLRARSTEHLQYILSFKIQAIPGIGRGETMLVLSSGLEWAPVGSPRSGSLRGEKPELGLIDNEEIEGESPASPRRRSRPREIKPGE